MNLEFLQAVALSVANEKSVEKILKRIVIGLADRPEIVLARIWLIKPGDICPTCPAKEECPTQTTCLHLVASDGQPLSADTSRPTNLNGRYRRFPIGIRKVGQIAETGEALLLTDIESDPAWVKDLKWTNKEQIRSFAGQPLIFRGEILGVLALFSRSVLNKTDLAILRTFADNASAAITNARTFEEVDRLRQQLEEENEYLKEEVRTTYYSDEILGRSSAVMTILEQIELVAKTESTVLIQGESGTGKELVARAIHKKSNRQDQRLVRVNCATIPEELFESEFFGHLKGAFTGAVRDRIGRFMLADGGTLFLDEVGEIPLSLQSKLLRVLQEGEFEPVGDDKSRKVDVRIIAATNRDLKAEVKKGNFREDLFYRLSVFPIDVPPLRQRKDDIPILADFFLKNIAERLSLAAPILKKKYINELNLYNWPGNIRELENVIERALIRSKGKTLSFNILKPLLESGDIDNSDINNTINTTGEVLTLDEMRLKERDNIILALKSSNWKIGGSNGAAELLGTKPTTLSSKIKAFKISKDI